MCLARLASLNDRSQTLKGREMELQGLGPYSGALRGLCDLGHEEELEQDFVFTAKQRRAVLSACTSSSGSNHTAP
jgi:hypothetical protein